MTTGKQLGFQGNLDDTRRIWGNLASSWDTRLPPWRPSIETIAIYDQLGGDALSKNVLLLGATPELRDLVARHGGRLTLVDICPEMVRAANTFLKHSPSDGGDVIVIADWCDLPLLDEQFDLVLGDFLFWLLSVPRQQVLLQEVSRVLVKSGRFITRVHYCNTDVLGIPYRELIIKHLKDVSEDEQGQIHIRELFTARLADATTDFTQQRLVTRDALPALESVLNVLDGCSREKDFLESFTNRFKNRTDWTSQTQAMIHEVLCQNSFTITAEKCARDFEDAQWYPILRLEKDS